MFTQQMKTAPVSTLRGTGKVGGAVGAHGGTQTDDAYNSTAHGMNVAQWAAQVA